MITDEHNLPNPLANTGYVTESESYLSEDSPQEGKMVIFTAPSGAGKTTLVSHVLHQRQDLAFSVSACTRTQREGEVHGRDYYFLSREEFEEKIKNGEFLEWEEVYEGTYYGTLRSEVQRIWQGGRHIIFDIDVEGALNIKREYDDAALGIFIKPPSVDVLEQRLLKRGSEGEKLYQMRIEKAKEELGYETYFDYVIVNNDFDKASREAEEVVNNFLSPMRDR